MTTEIEFEVLQGMMLTLDSDDPRVRDIKLQLDAARREVEDSALLARITRESGGYGYLNEKFEVLHYTSIPNNDDEAIGYSVFVEGWYADQEVKYIMKRNLLDHKYNMIPYKNVEGRWIKIEQSS